MTDTRELMANAKFFEGYSRYLDSESRYETWDEAVARVMDTHRSYFADKMTPELHKIIDEVEAGYKDKLFLGAQRALQFGGEQLLRNHCKLYNCSASYADRPKIFQETMFLLLSGAGVGLSILKKNVNKLPEIKERKKTPKVFTPEDSIEGWSDCIGVLMSSYFVGGGTFPEFEGRKVLFDLTTIRPKGALISGGFKAPGPDPLRAALDKIEYLLQGLVLKGIKRLHPIHVYDIIMHAADAVLAGGVRRSATIVLFDPDDEEMAKAKTGNWFIENPQRGRSNNSALLIRNQVTKEQFAENMKNTREFGEPGFIWAEDDSVVYNPCCEIGMYPKDEETGESGFQFCCLSEINGSRCVSKEEFYRACRLASAICTLQAGYTNFPYLGPVTESLVRREALIGVSITGWMNNPAVLFDEETLHEGARIVKETNAQIAKLIGINAAARCTTTKPAGNASVLLLTASGIHGEHSPRYIRNVQMNKEGEVANLIKARNPYMVESSIWSNNGTDYVISFPVESPKGSIFKSDLDGVKTLEKVLFAQKHWIEYGTNVDLCVNKTIRHNISNTVVVPDDEWKAVEDFVYANRNSFAGISFLAKSGDKDFCQAPFTEVLTESEMVEKYGAAALFASGLVVDGLKVYKNLWTAIDSARNAAVSDQETNDLGQDWNRRFFKFASNYFDGDSKKAEYCLKDVFLLHKWTKIVQNFKPIDFVSELQAKKFTPVDTLGAVACNGNQCELTF